MDCYDITCLLKNYVVCKRENAAVQEVQLPNSEERDFHIFPYILFLSNSFFNSFKAYKFCLG